MTSEIPGLMAEDVTRRHAERESGLHGEPIDVVYQVTVRFTLR